MFELDARLHRALPIRPNVEHNETCERQMTIATSDLSTFQCHGDNKLLFATSAIFRDWFITVSPVATLNGALADQSTFCCFKEDQKTEKEEELLHASMRRLAFS